MHDVAGLFFIVLFPVEKKKNYFFSQNFPFLIDV